jgi:hypothetical protein
MTWTSEQYLEFHKKTCEHMIAVAKAKNADYTGGTGDAFANFSRVELMGIGTTEQGFLTRMLDKFCRVTTFVKKGVLQVKDESVTDSLVDLANYCILMAGYIQSKRCGKS